MKRLALCLLLGAWSGGCSDAGQNDDDDEPPDEVLAPRAGQGEGEGEADPPPRPAEPSIRIIAVRVVADGDGPGAHNGVPDAGETVSLRLRLRNELGRRTEGGEVIVDAPAGLELLSYTRLFPAMESGAEADALAR